jgi:hypothetical protein
VEFVLHSWNQSSAGTFLHARSVLSQLTENSPLTYAK